MITKESVVLRRRQRRNESGEPFRKDGSRKIRRDSYAKGTGITSRGGPQGEIGKRENKKTVDVVGAFVPLCPSKSSVGVGLRETNEKREMRKRKRNVEKRRKKEERWNIKKQRTTHQPFIRDFQRF